MATFSIRVFGSIEIRRSSELLTDFRSQKALVLLAYLICEDRPVTREYLAGLAWPEAEQTQALGLLRRSLHDLTRQLPGCLELDRRTVCFSPTAPATVDLRTFISCVNQANVEAWVQAVALYRAPLLQGIYVDEAPELETWLLREQRHWQQQAVEVLKRLITYHTEQAQYAEALYYTRRLLAVEPWQEEAHHQTMLLLARLGQVSAALAQYKICRQTLAEELGVEPALETQTLYTRIKTLADTPPYPLPIATTCLVGRSEELTELTQLLASPTCRLITLVGPGGIGKTHLALETARQVASSQLRMFLQGVIFVPLAGSETPAQMVWALAQALAFSFQGQDKPETQLLNYLRDKEMLLVFDNFEQLIGQGSLSFLVKLLETAPEVKLLVTSRAQLNLYGEQLYWLRGLGYPRTPQETTARALEEVEHYSAIHLLIEAARRVDHGYALPPGAVPALVRICQLVQGMPLALELAAAWISVLSPTEIATEIVHNLDFLTSEAPNLPLRQRSMRAVFNTSWRLLAPTEQEAFQRLSVFQGGFTREAVQAITGTAPNVLVSLVNKSFLYKRPTGRFEIHELLRQYAAESLNQSYPATYTAHQRHSRYYVQRLAQWAIDLKGARQQAALLEMEAESDNLRAAWHWSIAQGQTEQIGQMMEDLGLFYLWRGRFQEGEQACQLACEKLGTVPSASAQELLTQTQVLTWQGIFCRHLGDTTRARTVLHQGLDLLDHIVGPTGERRKALLLLELGYLLIDSDRAQATSLFQQSLSVCKAFADEWGAANAYLGLGEVLRNLGDYSQAKTMSEKSMALREQLQDARGMARTLKLMSFIARDLGEPEEAEHLLQQQITIYRAIEDRLGLAVAYSDLGLIHIFQGKTAESFAWFEESLTLLTHLGHRREIGMTHWMLGIAKGFLGDYVEASTRGQFALICAQKLDNQFGIAHAHMLLGWVALGRQAFTEARQHLQVSATCFEQIGQRDELSQSLVWLSYSQIGLGNLPQARQLLARSLDLASEVKTLIPLIEALPAIAILLAKEGKALRAVEVYALVSHFPVLANTQLLEDIAGREIARVAATLPTNEVKTAQERERVRDLTATVTELIAELEAG